MARNNMTRMEEEMLAFDGLLSKKRKKESSMAVGPNLTPDNITAEEKRILKEMNKGLK